MCIRDRLNDIVKYLAGRIFANWETPLPIFGNGASADEPAEDASRSAVMDLRQFLMLEILQMLPIVLMMPILPIRSYCNFRSVLAGLATEQASKNDRFAEDFVAVADSAESKHA